MSSGVGDAAQTVGIPNALQRFLEDIVEPTFAEFQRNPTSARHAYLACVAVFHSIDRATAPKKPANLRKDWRSRSLEFRIVDMVAHKFKHVISDDEKEPVEPGKLRLSMAVFGTGTLNSYALNTMMPGEGGFDLRNLQFVIRDAIKFVREEASRLPPA